MLEPTTLDTEKLLELPQEELQNSSSFYFIKLSSSSKYDVQYFIREGKEYLYDFRLRPFRAQAWKKWDNNILCPSPEMIILDPCTFIDLIKEKHPDIVWWLIYNLDTLI